MLRILRHRNYGSWRSRQSRRAGRPRQLYHVTPSQRHAAREQQQQQKFVDGGFHSPFLTPFSYNGRAAANGRSGSPCYYDSNITRVGPSSKVQKTSGHLAGLWYEEKFLTKFCRLSAVYLALEVAKARRATSGLFGIDTFRVRSSLGLSVGVVRASAHRQYSTCPSAKENTHPRSWRPAG